MSEDARATLRVVSATRALVLSSFVLVACGRTASERIGAAAPTPTPVASPATATAPVSSAPGVRFVPAGPGDLVTVVAAFVRETRAAGRTPLVYVGASWCEPCGYFHRAAVAGELDAELGALSLLELDRDVDGARLDAVGYGSEMIPLFVVPGDDGRPTSARIEGSIHGPGSPAQIVPRLLAILGR